MTTEQFKRVCELKEKLECLNEVTCFLEHERSTCSPQLTYVKTNITPVKTSFFPIIQDILNKHDKMIRQEIRDMIDNTYKEISNL